MVYSGYQRGYTIDPVLILSIEFREQTSILVDLAASTVLSYVRVPLRNAQAPAAEMCSPMAAVRLSPEPGEASGGKRHGRIDLEGKKLQAVTIPAQQVGLTVPAEEQFGEFVTVAVLE